MHLADYPRPSVAVDTAALTIADDGRLSVVLVRPARDDAADDSRDGPRSWRLPGTFLHEGETLADAVLRSLRDKAGVTGREPRQLHVFDALDRDDRGWVLSVAHIDVAPRAALGVDPATAAVVAVDDLPPLPYDHESIVARACAALRLDYADRPDPHGLLRQPFTLRALRDVHEVIATQHLPRDAFRRAMQPHLQPTGDIAQGVVGKPARLFVTGADR